MIRLAVLISILACASHFSAKTAYYTYLNGFSHFADNPHSSLHDNYLQTQNQYSSDLICLDTSSVSHGHVFKFAIRLSNRNSDEGKSYSFTDSSTGKKHKIYETECGAVWNYIDSRNFYAVILRNSNNSLHDILDSRYLTVSVIRIQNGQESVLKVSKLSKGVNLGSHGFNLVRIESDGNVTSVCIGGKKMSIVAELSGIDYSVAHKFGYIVRRGANVDIERIVLSSTPTNDDLLVSQWDKSSLDNYFASSSDPLEGYWTYLDRNLNEERLKLGGKYTLALVKNGNGYDIIYVSGALVNDTKWTCGMIKGKLTRTIFVDNYDLLWYDSLKMPFSDDEYAAFENSKILTLNFPTQKSSFRLFKNDKYK